MYNVRSWQDDEEVLILYVLKIFELHCQKTKKIACVLIYPVQISLHCQLQITDSSLSCIKLLNFKR